VDVHGVAHFNAELRNVTVLRKALEQIGVGDEEKARIEALYEKVFDHQSFTGRSGTFYKYEGLGCIYWHMVAKLLLETQGALRRALEAGEDETTVERLRAHYRAIRGGIGVHKEPALYGAMPTDPYSHTPSFAGAQQPGMTGQVKEDILSRQGEMGVEVAAGRLGFNARLALRDEYLREEARFSYFDVEGTRKEITLAAGTLAYTFCQTPVVAHEAGPAWIEVSGRDGSRRRVEGLRLDAETSAAVFERRGSVERLDVYFGFAR
jgi:hypothetical protein